MSMELWQRLKDLEKKVAQLEERLNKPIPVVMNLTGSPDEPPKRMPVFDKSRIPKLRKPGRPPQCPKCGVKPAYFFHVKHCKGNAEVA